MKDPKFLKDFNEKNYIFRIGEVSKMTGVSPRQLRYWEQKGYIHSVRNEKMASRVFNHENFVMVRLIKHFLDEGCPLGAAIEKAQQRFQAVKDTHRIIMEMHHGFVEHDGITMMDMGYFDANQKQRLYSYLDDNGKLIYKVEKVNEKTAN
ncbi:MerR family transcriptional regulator [Fructilactobacillus frigidiflavus]|uniref:MerR family transcriptional regulator n=1 Tax=Fructilactobacillus frigidiflavus TaxID=3242688 RepID=UPI00375763D2